MKKAGVSIFLLISSIALFAQQDNGNAEGINNFPNYHPLVVHFPLILLLIAAVMQIAILFRSNNLFNYTVTALTVLGFITGFLAATVFHAHPSHDINATAHKIFETHEKLAFTTLWLSGIASLFKIAGLFTSKRWVEVVAFIFLFGSAVTVSIAGHHGSELVYKQGIGPKGEKLEKEHEH
ncbi:MAG: hypothetical protein J0H46_14560 [Bacteroidetes bacterium]|jgi:uncharacterized membrane protein|uniref:DUF2231 domain-containing protein n=1 Tax=uncultured Dysgonomonas sp. TaxID=206096 RepID=UPI001AD32E9B|nr:DUF2231 domain-containing protein [uncultured Dysgonomonas sp.]MBN9484573.1 hypothetical protein [Bacteroidota bacterium]